MKIVIPFWTFGKQGGYRVLSKLANEFQRMGIETIVICFEQCNEPYFPIECKIMYVNKKGEESVRQKEIIGGSIGKKIKNLILRYWALRKALNCLAEKGFDVVIANAFLTAYPVHKCRIQNKYYYIQAYETFDSSNRSILEILNNMIVKTSYRFNDLKKIVNADIYKDYKEIHSEYVVPPGLDLSIYYPKSDKWNNNRPLRVGCIGRKEKWKGSDDVAKAVDILLDKGIDIDFVVAFNPIECKKIKLVKPDGDDNLADYYRNIDVLVAPGKIQLGAIHYPVIEAMACKTIVITTGYYPADNNNSFIVPVSRPDIIADTIEHIMYNYSYAEKKAENALININKFAWNEVSKKMIDVIKHTSN